MCYHCKQSCLKGCYNENYKNFHNCIISRRKCARRLQSVSRLCAAWWAIRRRATPRWATPRWATSRRATSRWATPWRATPRRATPRTWAPRRAIGSICTRRALRQKSIAARAPWCRAISRIVCWSACFVSWRSCIVWGLCAICRWCLVRCRSAVCWCRCWTCRACAVGATRARPWWSAISRVWGPTWAWTTTWGPTRAWTTAWRAARWRSAWRSTWTTTWRSARAWSTRPTWWRSTAWGSTARRSTRTWPTRSRASRSHSISF
ncbi:unnamed protein product [Blepharisma stoltei]|uniref:Uncharacterized protein n=1 Tax=Blepharisma stoltei TaxID=1481888 RepID=A0AAU9ISZ5_9CILI|nr:unnamed protein product [Blepharisma stoltei]